VRRLLAIARPYWLHLGGILALGLLATPIALLQPLPLKLIVDNVVGGQPLPGYLDRFVPQAIGRSPTAILGLAAGLALAVALLAAARWTSLWLLQVSTGERLVVRLRSMLFRHVQRLSFSYHDVEGATDSTYRIQQDAPAIQNVLVYAFEPLLTAGFPVIGVTLVMLALDWQLALIALGAAPIVVLLVRSFSGPLRSRWNLVKGFDSSAMSVVQEVLGSLRVVKAFGREESEVERFEEVSRKRVSGHVGAVRMHCRFEGLLAATVGVATAGVLLMGTLHVLRGILTLGELIMVMSYVGQIFHPLQRMSQSATGLAASLASAQRALEVLDREPDVQERSDARAIERAGGAIELRDVSFGYAAGGPVLRDVTLTVPAGTRVGIQGRTGAGKSTLLSLLMRFYDPDRGAILLDGVDLRDYRLADLRDQFALVLQEPLLLSTTVRENIAYGRSGATDVEIESAARLANAHEFIERLPQGYRTEVGERGALLSGGERQRVALARAFLRDAPILVLDEPTSAVDVATEGAIIEALQRLMRDRTTFVITHRASALEGCDLLLVLENGDLRLIEADANRPSSTLAATERVVAGA